VFDSRQRIARRENTQREGVIPKVVHELQSALEIRRLAKGPL
jgi:hypothetical protein